MPDLSLTLQASPALFFLIAVIIAGISYFIYRITVPPIPGALKAALIVLRTGGLIAVVMLLFEPVLTVATTTVTPPRVALLVDDSRSMQLVDGAGDRAETAGTVLRSGIFDALERGNRLIAIRFAGEAEAMAAFHADSFQFGGPATNIDAAFRKLGELRDRENIHIGVLVTDGNYNAGPRPTYEAERLGIPIVAIGIGDSLEQRDVLVSRVIANEIAYLDTETPVDVRIRSTGFGGERIRVALRDEGGTVVDERQVELEEGAADYELSFSFQPEAEGMRRYTVEADELPGEVTHENNRQSFYVRVIDRKVNVQIVAGAPSQDVTFLRRTIEREESMEVSLSVEGAGGRFIGDEPTEMLLRGADVIILAGFPTRETPQPLIDRIGSVVREANKPVWYLESPDADPQRIDALLPAAVERTRSDERQTFAHVPERYAAHSIVRIGEGQGTVNWPALPPIHRTLHRYAVRPGSETVLTHGIQNAPLDEPLLVLRSAAGVRSAALLGYGIWRWRMLGRGGVDGEAVYDGFVLNMIEWLTADADQERVRITATKEQYHTGEAIEFVGEVYDEQYRPLPNAEVRVAVRSGERTYEGILSPRGHGRYEGRINPLPEGEYEYEGRAEFGNAAVGSDDGRFLVSELNLEYRDTRMNIQALRRIADGTGGAWVHPDETEKLADLLLEIDAYEARVETAVSDYQMWNLPAALAALVALFSLEWFLRKRNGML
jgi:hypothetical protein